MSFHVPRMREKRAALRFASKRLRGGESLGAFYAAPCQLSVNTASFPAVSEDAIVGPNYLWSSFALSRRTLNKQRRAPGKWEPMGALFVYGAFKRQSGARKLPPGRQRHRSRGAEQEGQG